MLQTATPIGRGRFAYGHVRHAGKAVLDLDTGASRGSSAGPGAALADIRALARCAAEIDDITGLAVLRHE
jgi:hypothetical protein